MGCMHVIGNPVTIDLRKGVKMLRSAILGLLNGQSVDFVDVMMYVASCFIIIFLVLPLHEYAHARMALKLGDHTAEYVGRVTLNPLASVDPLGALCILLFGFGWAKPVPINTRFFRKPRRDTALVAIMGPLSNLVAAFIGMLLWYGVALLVPIRTMMAAQVMHYFLQFLWYYVFVNISLAVFNLLPIPPLDGSRVLSAFLSPRGAYLFNRYQREIYLVLMFALLLGVLNVPLNYIDSWVMQGLDWLASLPFKLFGLL